MTLWDKFVHTLRQPRVRQLLTFSWLLSFLPEHHGWQQVSLAQVIETTQAEEPPPAPPDNQPAPGP